MNDTLLVLLWAEWSFHHVARLRALSEIPALDGRIAGIELFAGNGGNGVCVRHLDRDGLLLLTLFPKQSVRDLPLFEAALKLWTMLDRVDASAVAVPGYGTTMAFLAAIWALARRRKVILLSDSTQVDRRRAKLKEFAKKVFLRFAVDCAIVAGQRSAAYLASLGLDPGRVLVGCDVVDNDFFAEQSSKCRAERQPSDYGLPGEYFLFVGRLVTEKNLHNLIRAFNAYRSQGGRWHLVIVGDGPLRSSLNDAVTNLLIADRVHLTGWAATSFDLVPYYAFAKSLVLPSISETWGLVVNEAMACGLPVVVSSQCGCSPDLVRSGENGCVFDAFNTDAMVEALVRTGAKTPDTLRSMGAESRRIVSSYSLDRWSRAVHAATLPGSVQ